MSRDKHSITEFIKLVIILTIIPNHRNNLHPFRLEKEDEKNILKDCFIRIKFLIDDTKKREVDVEWM